MGFSTIYGPDFPIGGPVPTRGPLGASLDLPIGARVAAYVRSTGVQDGDSDNFNTSMLVTTVAAGLARCRAGKGDVVLVLPGHTENVGTTMLTGAPAGSRIVGVGVPDQDDAPTLNWSAAGSNLAVSMKNLTIANLRLVHTAGAATTAGITVTAAGFKLLGCYVVLSGASYGFTKFISHTAGGGIVIAGNTAIGAAGAADFYVQSGTTAIDGVTIDGNYISGVTSATTSGVVQFTGTSTGIVSNIRIANNRLRNAITNSLVAMNFSNIAHTGLVTGNFLTIEASGTAAALGAAITLAGTNVAVRFCENYAADGVNSATARSGVLTPLVHA
jgi:hypothetical protein